MPKPRKSPSANENWVKEETLTEWRTKAEIAVDKRHDIEKEWIKGGKKQVRVPHPTSPRCFILKFM